MHWRILNEQFVTAKIQNDVVQSRMSTVVQLYMYVTVFFFLPGTEAI